MYREVLKPPAAIVDFRISRKKTLKPVACFRLRHAKLAVGEHGLISVQKNSLVVALPHRAKPVLAFSVRLGHRAAPMDTAIDI
jgi:hypothetical protein